jgi:hypothetical protein
VGDRFSIDPSEEGGGERRADEKEEWSQSYVTKIKVNWKKEGYNKEISKREQFFSTAVLLEAFVEIIETFTRQP